MLGLKQQAALVEFAHYIRERYQAEAGFITMNMPRLVDALEGAGLKNPIVCANINKIGFRMSGGIEAYKTLLKSRRCRSIAMSVFASGAIPAREAIEWACSLDGLDSIVFGASSHGNIRQTKELIDKAWTS
jgi:phosphoribosylformimino-5-aminoimidazole carboxamide ribonucleotide (ProFAR) isomerase